VASFVDLDTVSESNFLRYEKVTFTTHPTFFVTVCSSANFEAEANRGEDVAGMSLRYSSVRKVDFWTNFNSLVPDP
jgi:hypothetical protein